MDCVNIHLDFLEEVRNTTCVENVLFTFIIWIFLSIGRHEFLGVIKFNLLAQHRFVLTSAHFLKNFGRMLFLSDGSD